MLDYPVDLRAFAASSQVYPTPKRTRFLASSVLTPIWDQLVLSKQLDGLIIKGQENKVYKLKGSLYGLNQSSRQWYRTFHLAMIEFGFVVNRLDHCVYIMKSGSSFTILSLYVDDILLASNDLNMIQSIKSWLNSKFEMKDMGEASYVLGIKIMRNRKRKNYV